MNSFRTLVEINLYTNFLAHVFFRLTSHTSNRSHNWTEFHLQETICINVWRFRTLNYAFLFNIQWRIESRVLPIAFSFLLVLLPMMFSLFVWYRTCPIPNERVEQGLFGTQSERHRTEITEEWCIKRVRRTRNFENNSFVF